MQQQELIIGTIKYKNNNNNNNNNYYNKKTQSELSHNLISDEVIVQVITITTVVQKY